MPPTIEFASLGMWDSLILMVMALVVFGPRRLPQIGRQIGKLMYEFRKASNDFKFQMEEELRNAEEADRRKKEEERLRALTPPAATTAQGTDLVSPVAEPSAGTPGTEPAVSEERVVDAQFPVPSPYPGEDLYPSSLAPATTPAPPAEETYPRIQPPSTGVPVPAAWPTLPEAPVEIPAPVEEERTPSASDIAYAEARAEAYREAEARSDAARARAEALAKAEAARARAAATTEIEAEVRAETGRNGPAKAAEASAAQEKSSSKPVKHNG
ncbi:MAG: twin-arginine translocase TatA/TatE family subunit [Terracidiphilus sp.]